MEGDRLLRGVLPRRPEGPRHQGRDRGAAGGPRRQAGLRPTGTSSLRPKLRTYAGVVAVAATHTGCLVLLQQGKIDAITGDDTVLAGLAAQDPYAVVTTAAAVTAEPYGLGFKADAVGLVRAVNGLLDAMKSDGRWTQIYTRWLAGPLGPAPKPPASVYGR